MSSFWKNKPLEKVIRYPIEYHQIHQEKVKPGRRLEIQEANDLFFVTNETQALTAFWTYLSMSILCSIMFFFISLSGVKGGFPLKYYLVTLPTTIIALFHLTVFFLVPVKEVVLDRVNGKITYPRLFGNKEHRTIQFDSLHVFETMTTTGDFAATGKKIRIRDRKYDYTWDLESSKPDEYWSFMVWYMDKNRPLPLGTAFDPYREKDFERRKAEGFPKPLYPSRFETPEDTSAQQRERKKIGGW
jgi:hypothetical protein